jgi:hypothetical protein
MIAIIKRRTPKSQRDRGVTPCELPNRLSSNCGRFGRLNGSGRGGRGCKAPIRAGIGGSRKGSFGAQLSPPDTGSNTGHSVGELSRAGEMSADSSPIFVQRGLAGKGRVVKWERGSYLSHITGGSRGDSSPIFQRTGIGVPKKCFQPRPAKTGTCPNFWCRTLERQCWRESFVGTQHLFGDSSVKTRSAVLERAQACSKALRIGSCGGS